MHTTIHRAVLALSATLMLASAQAQQPVQAQQAAPELGRWITESGNLEVEIAPCGDALCGTITRVIANNAMSPGAAAPAPAAAPVSAPATPAASPLGKKILFGLKPIAAGGLQGQIYNRENNKTYNSQLNAIDANQLKLTMYETTPEQGRVQVWRRAAVVAAQ